MADANPLTQNINIVNMTLDVHIWMSKKKTPAPRKLTQRVLARPILSIRRMLIGRAGNKILNIKYSTGKNNTFKFCEKEQLIMCPSEQVAK